MSTRNTCIEPSNDPAPLSSPLIVKAARLADEGRCDRALEVLASGNGSGPELQNARGVCLMRLDRFADAVRIYRLLVLKAGCTWMRPGLPVIYRTNFSTSLVLRGLVAGGVSTLNEIRRDDHPSVIRLREAIRRWERSLSLWQRLNWKLDVTPDVPVVLDFAPGDFMDPRTFQVTAPPSTPGQSSPANHQAA